GAFLTMIMERYPLVHGTLFDQPHVIARATAPQSGGASNGRYSAVGGDFFDGVPEGGDAYLLKWILHDWSDDACIKILKACRGAMKPMGRLLVAEYVIGPGHASPEGELMDLTMMVMNGGRERTRAEFATIFLAAGFELTSVTPTATPLCLIEGAVSGA
ncbi:MAG: methyltransferase, partial [Beijerinckiaceae bacterium]